jgi:O-methyltransferase
MAREYPDSKIGNCAAFTCGLIPGEQMVSVVKEQVKSAIQGLLRRAGYQLGYSTPSASHRSRSQEQPLTGCQNHEEIRPGATYAPWNADPEFIAAYEAIKDHSLVDKYRCWELWCLLSQSAKLDPGAVLEVGVWRGGTGALLARKAELIGLREPIYLCDTFTGVVKAGSNDTRYKGGEHADTSRQIVEILTREKMKLTNVEILEGIFPDQTAHLIKDQSLAFRFCHIDVDVYQSAKDVVKWVWPRMVRGGIIVYDDYGFQGCDGIAKFVDEQIGDWDRFVYHNLNGHAVVIKMRNP